MQGVDLGKEYVEFGRDRYGLALSTGDLASLLLDQQPDVVIYSHVLEHVLTPNEELGRVRQLLGDAGVIYVELPGVKNLMRSYEMDLLRYLQNAHVYHFTLTTLTNLMQLNRFTRVAGDEFIRSVFEKSQSASSRWVIVNDHDEVLRYLSIVERLRAVLPIAPYRVPLLAKRAAVRALRTVGLDRPLRALSRRLRRRAPR